jgi:catechol 2,3-dioxygenase-like lactoylglutathione lyase family enzyme
MLFYSNKWQMNNSIQPPIQAQYIQAIELTVADLDCSVNFYIKALHFEVVSDITVIEKDADEQTENQSTRVQIVTLKLGDETIRLMQYLDSAGESIPADSQSNDLWFQHLAIVVRDMDTAYAHLQSFSIEPISTAPQTIPPGNKEAAYIQSFKFRDPDRHPLELIWFPPDKGQEKWHQPTDRLFLGIDHTAIVVANTAQSLQFYRDQLGMQVDGGSFNWGETQARMDGLPAAKVRITALRPTQGGLGIELLEYIEPANGRPIPAHLKPNDVAYVQVELVANLTTDDVFDHPMQYVSQDASLTQNNSLLNHPVYRIKDPTGHSLLMIPNQEGV